MARGRLGELRRLGRAAAARGLAEARASGDVVAARLVIPGDACGPCEGSRGLVIPIRACRAGMLPPYPDCELESGCLSSHAFEAGPPAADAGVASEVFALIFGARRGR